MLIGDYNIVEAKYVLFQSLSSFDFIVLAQKIPTSSRMDNQHITYFLTRRSCMKEPHPFIETSNVIGTLHIYNLFQSSSLCHARFSRYSKEQQPRISEGKDI